MKCRHCATPLHRQFLDLGHAPPSNAYLSVADLSAPEVTYPLRVFVCDKCHLVQTDDFASATELFSADYAYFSSTSLSWLAHAEAYAAMITARLGLDSGSKVIEIASNDGYLLKNFMRTCIPCLGIEPTDGTADAAEALGIPVLRAFFGEATARHLAASGHMADLVCGNNVYAHVPDINDFTRGLAIVLKPEGVITLEFPHLLRMIEHCQFDTAYHEHFSYLSLSVVCRIFDGAGLRVFDVERLPTHGGSLRIYGCHVQSAHPQHDSVAQCLAGERDGGLAGTAVYDGFQARANAVKDALVAFLIETKRAGCTVAGYGAAAKGNTLMNYAGIRPDLVSFIADAAASKQGRFMPGSHIPILPPQALTDRRPDFVLILPWNLADEISSQLAPLARQGTRFVTAVPELQVR
jgi:hypothetical protein